MRLENDWSKQELENIYTIMDKYSKLDNYRYTDIENDFREKLNMDYNDLKPLFIHFCDSNEYESVIAKYLETIFLTRKSVSLEYNEIFDKYRKNGLIKI
ncbi:hypothetical protein [Leptotrichia hongkongensis]|uniref:hypothetical protein n=1 Tax=Leptotrichia hongkongensis TaxID=554406 RepID=UPI0035A8A7FC